MKKFALMIFLLGILSLSFFQLLDWINAKKTMSGLKDSKRTVFLEALVSNEVKVVKSHRTNLRYSFFYKDFFIGSRQITKLTEIREFPFKGIVAVDSVNPEKNYLIVTESDYNYFKIKIVDSMKWMLESFK